MSGSNGSPGPGWPTFIAVVTLLTAALVGGFAFMWMRMDAMTQAAADLEGRLSDAQAALASSQLEVQDQAKRVSDTASDIESLAGAVSDLGHTVDTQSQRTLDVAEVRSEVEQSVVTVNCGYDQGTGFAVDVADLPDGFSTAIITNYHVVEGCTGPDAPEPWVGQGQSTPATKLGDYDTDNDLAVLYIDTDLPTLPFADPAAVGDPVLAIGSPYGYSGTVTSGIVTNVQPDSLTTDAATGPGNSGGPLIDRSGAALGVITAEFDRSEGQNYVVAIDVVCRKLLQCS